MSYPRRPGQPAFQAHPTPRGRDPGLITGQASTGRPLDGAHSGTSPVRSAPGWLARVSPQGACLVLMCLAVATELGVFGWFAHRVAEAVTHLTAAVSEASH